MKKALVFLTIAAILILGVTGALAVIPHVHGHDFDHSKHSDCPVYQAGLQTTVSVLAVWVFTLFLQLAFRYDFAEPFFLFLVRCYTPSLRAPPSPA